MRRFYCSVWKKICKNPPLCQRQHLGSVSFEQFKTLTARKIGFTHIYSWANMMQTRCKCVANMVNAVFTSLLHRACKCVSKYGIYHVCHTFAPRLHHICSWVNVSKSNFSCSDYSSQLSRLVSVSAGKSALNYWLTGKFHIFHNNTVSCPHW